MTHGGQNDHRQKIKRRKFCGWVVSAYQDFVGLRGKVRPFGERGLPVLLAPVDEVTVDAAPSTKVLETLRNSLAAHCELVHLR